MRYRYTRPGKGVTVYDQVLVLDRPNVSVLLTPAYGGPAVTVNGAAILEPGAPIVWFVFPGAWADVGRFHGADGTFTGWYTNFCTPVTRTEREWASTDLLLDLWIPAAGKPRWLDEQELTEAIDTRVLDRWTVGRVEKERERIATLLAAGDWPPPMCRETDLALVRAALAAAS